MRRVFTHLTSGRQRVLAMAIKTRIVPLWSRQNKTTKVSNAAASSPSLPSCQHASHKPQRRVLPSLRQWRKRSTGKTDHTTATCTVTLPAHFVSPLIRDNALASKVGSPCPKFPRSASCGCDSGRIRVPVQGLGSNACSLRGNAAIWDACHVESQHPAGVPVVTDKSHHATPLHFKLHCTAASAGGGWSRRATKPLLSMNGSQTDKTIVVALDDFIKVLTYCERRP